MNWIDWGLAIAVVAAIAGAFVAALKGRSTPAWIIMCFFFPPLFLVLLILSRLDAMNDRLEALEHRKSRGEATRS